MAKLTKRRNVIKLPLGVLVTVMLLVGASADPASTCPQHCALQVNRSGTWCTYTDGQQRFLIQYPGSFMSAVPGDEFASASADVTFIPTFDPSIGKNGVRTNLGEVWVTVTMAADTECCPEQEPACFAQQVSSAVPKTKVIAGRCFTVTCSSDAGAGNVYETITYRTSWGEVPYEISLFFHYGNLACYAEGTVTAFDPEPFVEILDAMASTFRMSVPTHSTLSPECASWPPHACVETRSYGDYIVKVWRSLDETAPTYYRAVTVDRCSVRLLCQDWTTGLDPLSGTDINGTGYPDLIIQRYTGGAHCCFGVDVYDLASSLLLIDVPASPGGNAMGTFVDLNGDGVFEYETRDDSFAYTYCCFAGSPFTLVILEYSPLQGRYIPASYRYPVLYQDEICLDTQRARALGLEEADGGWDGTGKCDVLPLVLDYLYSGRAASAWAALEAYYPESDRDAFRAEIESVVEASPYYAAP